MGSDVSLIVLAVALIAVAGAFAAMGTLPAMGYSDGV